MVFEVGPFREQRREILADRTRVGQQLIGTLTSATNTFLHTLAGSIGEWGAGWSLVAVGGTGRNELCPGSDIDLLILHPRKADQESVRRLSEALWYPIWDAGLKGTPSAHTVDSAIGLADREVLSAVTWLSARHLIGDATVSAQLIERAGQRWKDRAKSQLPALFAETLSRHDRAGDVAFLLEPDLRDGRGGLRDVHVLLFLERSEHPLYHEVCDRPLPELSPMADLLLGVRAELHRVTNRPSDRLLLQEQDAVADVLGFATADSLMGMVAAAGRAIGWSTEETIRRFTHRLEHPRARFGANAKVRKLTIDIGVADEELVLLETADTAGDPTLVLRLAAMAAQERMSIARASLLRLATDAPIMPVPWPERARNALVALLGAGSFGTHVLEALDRHDLVTRFLPEWSSVRSKPQRNAYHRFTVDRHLCEAAANAAELVRTVSRPDLLLVGTWLHDLGKGYPGDHTVVGIDLMTTIGARMGFDAADVDVLCDMVRHHLFLPEVATRRDLTDPGTITAAAAAVGDLNRLELLRALTEADSLATGPTAWSDWKKQLVDELTNRTADVLHGNLVPQTSMRSHDHDDLLEQARTSGEVVVRVNRLSPDVEMVAIAAPDRTGLFAALSGSLTLVGADVLSADVWTTDDNYALDVFRITRQLGGETNYRKLGQLIDGALAGTLDVNAELARRARTYARSRSKSAGKVAPPSVTIDNETPSLATMFEVRAPDGLAVLYRVTNAISALGLDLRTAKVATIGHEVVDSFALRAVDSEGRKTKLADADCEQVRTAILESLVD
jgi:[protein-PII] uridylyltransferase